VTGRDHDPLEGLSPGARRRLDAFADAFQQLNSEVYASFAAASLDPDERREALARVQELIGQGSRRAGVLAALGEFREFAVRAAASGLAGYESALATRSNVSSPEERVKFLASLELAVVAVVLWDEMEPEERSDLLGPWEEMATRAVVRA
jgi:hypothetical protein